MGKLKIKSIGNEQYILIKGDVLNPLNTEKRETVEFLVDTGASGCALPLKLARKLGLEEMGFVEAALADGTVKKVRATYVGLVIQKRKVLTWAIYDKGFTPIIGLDVMRVLGFHIDTPEKKVLVPIKKFNIKSLRIFTGFHFPSVGPVLHGGGRGSF